MSEQAPLDAALKRALTDVGGMPFVRHPLVVGLYHESMNAQMNGQLAYKREATAAALKGRDMHKFIALHERPFRLTALIEYMEEVKPERIEAEELAEQIVTWWADAEAPGINSESWRLLFSRYVQASSIGIAAKAATPGLLYRGVAGMERKPGLSWTTCRESAEWFARRSVRFNKGRKPVLYSVAPTPDEVLGFYRDRGEAEFILNPRLVVKNPTRLAARLKGEA